MAADNVALFTKVSPIPVPFGSFESEGILLGQYVSLSVVGFSDQSFSISFEFSGDGIHYDVGISRSFDGGIGQNENLPVLAKWTKIKIIDTSGIVASVLRIFVYGTPSTSALTAILGKIGNLNPKVDVGADLQRTSYDEIAVQSYVPLAGLKTTNIQSGTLFGNGEFTSPYEHGFDLIAIGSALGDSITSDHGSIVNSSVLGGAIGLVGDSFGGSSAVALASKIIPYSPGVGFEVKFSASFDLGGAARSSNPKIIIGALDLYGDHATTVGLSGFAQIVNGFAVGYYENNTSSFLSFCHFEGLNPPTVIPSTNWNIDQADGNGILPELNPTNLNLFKITFGFLGIGEALLSIAGNDGRFRPAHRFTFANKSTKSNLSASSLRVGMFNDSSSMSYAGPAGIISTAGWSIGRQGPPNHIENPFTYVFGATATSPGFFEMFSLRNAHNTDGGFPQVPPLTGTEIGNTSVCKLVKYKFWANSGAPDGNIIGITKNATLSGAAWGDLSTDGKHRLEFDLNGSGMFSGKIVEWLSICPGTCNIFEINLEVQPGTTYSFFSTAGEVLPTVAASVTYHLM